MSGRRGAGGLALWSESSLRGLLREIGSLLLNTSRTVKSDAARL